MCDTGQVGSVFGFKAEVVYSVTYRACAGDVHKDADEGR